MLISKWRVRSHRYFGSVQVPIVELEIKSSAGQFCPFSLCVDSGAVVSLLPSSAGEVLGVKLANGRPIQLGGVGENRIDACLHELDVLLADLPPITIPFAIVLSDKVPALLGRLGFFDRLEIIFDSVNRETRIQMP